APLRRARVTSSRARREDAYAAAVATDGAGCAISVSSVTAAALVEDDLQTIGLQPRYAITRVGDAVPDELKRGLPEEQAPRAFSCRYRDRRDRRAPRPSQPRHARCGPARCAPARWPHVLPRAAFADRPLAEARVPSPAAARAASRAPDGRIRAPQSEQSRRLR